MKINREARQAAKQLFRACHKDGRLQESTFREVVRLLAEKKPRHYIAILQRLLQLLKLEVDARTVSIEAAVDLPDQGASLMASLEKRFGPALATSYAVRPELVGGVRVQRGSDVWDGTILGRLNAFKLSLNSLS